MNVVESGKMPFRAYARLISLLGDQLITDKWVGVIELVKNCYDADAENVSVRFVNFQDGKPSTIEIEDDGIGMDVDTIRDVYMKPATPNKFNKKKRGKQATKNKGRILQGEKGVGRFASFKLGNKVEIFTKTSTTEEVKVILDFYEYTNENNNDDYPEKFLDEVENYWEIREKAEEIRNDHGQGTLIRISDLRETWVKEDCTKLLTAFRRMIPPDFLFSGVVPDFSVNLLWNEETLSKDFQENTNKLLELAPYYLEGSVDLQNNLEVLFRFNTKEKRIKFNLLNDAQYDIGGLRFFKEKAGNIRMNNVGGFMFFFYVYDLTNLPEGLTKIEKEYIKENSVYLYRDNVRVYPYGEKGDDWLGLSKQRAEDKAGKYFSYRDLIGYVFITQSENPLLSDAANREGLMNIDGAKDAFIAILHAVLKVMKDEVDIVKLEKELAKLKAPKSFEQNFENAYSNFQSDVLKINQPELNQSAERLLKTVNTLILHHKERVEITQDLAGTGMAIEKATHDMMVLLQKLRDNTSDILRKVEKNLISIEELRNFFEEVQQTIEFLLQEFQVLHPLFRVSRKITRDVSVRDVVERTTKYFRRELEGKVKFTISPHKDISLRTNTGLILQVMINLMDNAVYWLKQQDKEKEIFVKIDPDNSRVIFADSGRGVDEELKDIIFMEFFSKKVEGRGLGLYIVKELLERIDAKISLITEPRLKVLKGANFLIEFNPQN